MTGKTVERRNAVHDIVGLRSLLVQLVEMLARRHVVANIHQRDCVVEVLFRRLELCGRSPFQMLSTGAEMNVSAISQFLAWSGDDLLKMRFGLVEFVLLHGAQA